MSRDVLISVWSFSFSSFSFGSSHRYSSCLYTWTCDRKDSLFLLCFVSLLWQNEQGKLIKDALLVLHNSFSWLWIRRRGWLCRRWMFLQTTRGTRSICRFCAMMRWMELLIDFSWLNYLTGKSKVRVGWFLNNAASFQNVYSCGVPQKINK